MVLYIDLPFAMLVNYYTLIVNFKNITQAYYFVRVSETVLKASTIASK